MKKFFMTVSAMAVVGLLLPAAASAKSKTTSHVIQDNKVAFVWVDNKAHVENTVVVGANTGGNTQRKNQGEVKMTTGDATATATVTNRVNNVKVNLTQGCNECDGVSVKSEEEHGGIIVSGNDVAGVGVKNLACVENTVMVGANTGGNTQTKNHSGEEGDASMTTGDATATANVKNAVNFATVTVQQ